MSGERGKLKEERCGSSQAGWADSTKTAPKSLHSLLQSGGYQAMIYDKEERKGQLMHTPTTLIKFDHFGCVSESDLDCGKLCSFWPGQPSSRSAASFQFSTLVSSTNILISLFIFTLTITLLWGQATIWIAIVFICIMYTKSWNVPCI